MQRSIILLFPVLAGLGCDAARDRPALPFAGNAALAQIFILRPDDGATVHAADLFGPGISTRVETRGVPGPGVVRVVAWHEGRHDAPFYDTQIPVESGAATLTTTVRPAQWAPEVSRIRIAGKLLDTQARSLAADTVGVWVQP